MDKKEKRLQVSIEMAYLIYNSERSVSVCMENEDIFD